MEDTAVFRPPKRRKFARQQGNKSDNDDNNADGHTLPIAKSSTQLTSEPDATGDEGETDMSSLLKLRRQQRSRPGGGVQFSSTRPTATDDAGTDSTSLIPTTQEASDTLKGIADRFVGHSGQVVDVDKHMMAYIDSEMAKQRSTMRLSAATETATFDPSTTNTEVVATTASINHPSHIPARQPASLGLLNEVPLPATETNPAAAANNPPPPRPRRPRLDRFGRPLPPRKPRASRPEADIARDALVEAVLAERHQDGDSSTGGVVGTSIYQRDNPTVQSANASRKADDAKTDAKKEDDADSRLAAQFQQDYLDAMQNRMIQQQQKKQKQLQQQQKKTAGAGGADAEAGSYRTGPKLGGSRQQRAAMRERELARLREGKTGK